MVSFWFLIGGIVHQDGKKLSGKAALVVVAGMETTSPHCVHNQEAEKDERWCSTHFLFIQSQTPAHLKVPHAFRVGLPS